MPRISSATPSPLTFNPLTFFVAVECGGALAEALLIVAFAAAPVLGEPGLGHPFVTGLFD